MSRLTEQITQLNNEADLVECTHEYTAKLLREASDTLDSYQKALDNIRSDINTWLSAPCLNETDKIFDRGLKYALKLINKYDPIKIERDYK